jgi:hypothetical protein
MEFIIDLLLEIIAEAILVPIKFILATPVILVLSLIKKGSYSDNLKNYYKRLWNWHKPRFRKNK